MNTYQIIAFVNHLKKEKNISNGKRKMVSNIASGSNHRVDSVNINYFTPKELGDKRIRISNR